MWRKNIYNTLNYNITYDAENIYICELQIKLMGNVINIFLYNIENLIITLVYTHRLKINQ